MKTNSIRFEVNDSSVTVFGIPELEGCQGRFVGDGVASFIKDGHEWYLVNADAGKWRKMKSHGHLILDDSEVDYDSVKANCQNGLYNAERKLICYADVWLYDGRFENGLSAISWMIYPDGMYFADSDGFGMEDNHEEDLYAIIDSNLDIVEPFRPIRDIGRYLRMYRKAEKEILISNEPSAYDCIVKLPEYKPSVEYHIFLDESASMSRISDEALGKLYKVLQSIADEQNENPDKDYLVTIVRFNEVSSVWCVSVPILDVPRLSKEDYSPADGTALFATLSDHLYCYLIADEFNDCHNVIVITDGHDTVSHLMTWCDDVDNWDSMIASLEKCNCTVDVIIVENDYVDEVPKYYYDEVISFESDI